MRAVAVAPRPADAVLSCGGTLAGLAAGGWRVTLVALEAGDAAREAADLLGLAEVVDVGVRRTAPEEVAAALGPAIDAEHADRILAPLGLGGRPEHAAVVAALGWLRHPAPVVRWRDVPDALEQRITRPRPGEQAIPIARQLERKLDACVPFAGALGGEAAMRAALRAFHEQEGRRLGVDGPAEVLVEPPPDPRRERARREEARRQEQAAMAKLRAQLRG